MNKYFFVTLLFSMVSIPSVKAQSADNIIYKHYKGTIGKYYITADLSYAYSTSSNKWIFSGSYYYKSKGGFINLNPLEDSANNMIHMVEEVVAGPMNTTENSEAISPRWEFTFKEDSVKGKWINKAKGTVYDIALAEDYLPTSYPLDIISIDDSLSVKVNNSLLYANASYEIVMPNKHMGKTDQYFIMQNVLKMLDGDSSTLKNLEEHIKKTNSDFISEFGQTVIEIGVDTTERTPAYSEIMTVLYNDKNILEIELQTYDYTGGPFHGVYSSAYKCIDVKEKRIWTLSDIIKDSDDYISKLLEKDVRRYFRLKSTDALSNTLLVNSLDLSENFYFNEHGIVFEYDPYQIAAWSYGKIEVYLPYEKLGKFLTPAFKKRMHLPG